MSPFETLTASCVDISKWPVSLPTYEYVCMSSTYLGNIQQKSLSFVHPSDLIFTDSTREICGKRLEMDSLETSLVCEIVFGDYSYIKNSLEKNVNGPSRSIGIFCVSILIAVYFIFHKCVQFSKIVQVFVLQ